MHRSLTKEVLIWSHFIVLVVFNIEVGVFFGLLLSIFFSVFELVGEYWGFQMGFSMSKAYSSFSNNEANVLSQLLSVITIYIFLLLGGELQFFDFIAHSFKSFPLLGNTLAENRGQYTDLVAQIFSFVFKSGLEFSLTVVGAILLANVFVGLLSKASPQINAMSFGLSVYTFLGFLLLWILVPITLNSMVNYLHNIMSKMKSIFT